MYAFFSDFSIPLNQLIHYFCILYNTKVTFSSNNPPVTVVLYGCYPPLKLICIKKLNGIVSLTSFQCLVNIFSGWHYKNKNCCLHSHSLIIRDTCQKNLLVDFSTVIKLGCTSVYMNLFKNIFHQKVHKDAVNIHERTPWQWNEVVI